jgi:polyisoprenoid-binding protein YceI
MTCDTTSVTRRLDGVELPVPGTYELDATHSYIGFSARHLMVSRVRGQFRSFRGTLTIAEDPSTSTVVVEIDAASIDTRDPQRDAHLRSADFLHVECYPTITYRSSWVWPVVAWAPDGRDQWHVEGELTLHGVTRSVDLDVCFGGGVIDPHDAARVGFTASADFIRDDFGLTWNQALEAGGVVVGRKVKVEIGVEAVRFG